MTPEKLIKTKIRTYLKSVGAYYFAPVQSGYGSDTVDILCCLDGRFVGIEVKVPGKTPSARQDLAMATIRAAGGIAFWCTSVEEVKAFVEDRK